LLMALVIPRLTATAKSAKMGACKQNMLTAASGIEAYYIENRGWPDSLDDVKDYVGEEALKCPEDGTDYVLTFTVDGLPVITCETHNLTLTRDANGKWSF
ncbi:MAG: hypothetical protein AB1609_23660, partial [Bacillota bacterium]